MERVKNTVKAGVRLYIQ